MFGCLAGGYISDMIDPKAPIVSSAFCSRSALPHWAVFPRTETMFIVFTCVYVFVLGLSYAALGAVTLGAIGTGAATIKYNVIAGLSNVPMAYQTLVDGLAHTRWGSGGVLWVEAACGDLAVTLYYLFAFATPRIAGAFAAAQPAQSTVI